MSIDNRNLKPGTVLVAVYPARGPKRKEYRCEVVAGKDGKVAYRLKGGRTFTSPSAAGTAVMGGTACNGWRFWTVEGAAKPAGGATEPQKTTSKAKAAPRPKGSGKAKTGAKRVRKAAKPSKNGAEPARLVACGDCGREFPDARAAADHMRDEHGSHEAVGTGGR